MRAGAERYAISVASDELDGLRPHPEPLAQQLRKARLVALAARQGADDHLDDAFRAHRNLRAFLRRAALRLDIGAESNAANPSQSASATARSSTAWYSPLS